jgi:proline-specific peptidase
MDLTVNGARLYYETMGPEGAPALVLLHGAPGLSDCRDQVRDYSPLADEFRLLFFDIRGCGRSEEQPPYTHDQWVADVDELTRQVGIDTFALLGHSYGGIIAQEYVLAHPERLTKLILLATSPSTVENDETINRALAANLPGLDERNLRQLFEGRTESNEELREMRELLMPLYFEGPFDPELPKQIADRAFFHYETHNYAFAVNNPAYDVREGLRDVKVPTLVLSGGNDWITPLAKSQEITSLIPASRLEVFENSGHMPNVEEHDKLMSVLRSFLRE